MNRINPDGWKADIVRSVDMYNSWFLEFAPTAFRETRIKTTAQVEDALQRTQYLSSISAELLRNEPGVMPVLRMSTCPPIAVDRLVGLSGASKNLIGCMEAGSLPARMSPDLLMRDLERIATIIKRMADPDIFAWIGRKEGPTESEVYRAATIVADRLCGSIANPIIKNAQEKRQLAAIANWLDGRAYIPLTPGFRFNQMPPGTYSFRLNVPVQIAPNAPSWNIPVDAVIQPRSAKEGDLPLLVEAKSAGDYTNPNKRRKEEATKISQLRSTYGNDVKFILFLCGYFDSGYLGYEAAEGIDWVWEHRIEDFEEFGM